MLGRATFICVFAALLALRPSYELLSVWRTCSNCSWPLWQTAVSASLADVFEGQELAVALAKIDAQQGVAMLAEPLVGGRLAEYSFRACFALSAACGGAGMLVYAFGYRDTLQRSSPPVTAQSPTTKSARSRSMPKIVSAALAVINPLGFLRLFYTSKALARLTLAWTLSEVCDGTMEIDRH